MRKTNVHRQVFTPKPDSPKIHLPQILSLVPAGFPSPADDYLDASLDLNEYLIKNKAASFYIRVSGESMNGAGILSGDILLVDRSLDPINNRIVVAIIDGEMVLKRLRITNGETFLVSENPKFKPIKIFEDMDFYIWGVVSAVARKLG